MERVATWAVSTRKCEADRNCNIDKNNGVFLFAWHKSTRYLGDVLETPFKSRWLISYPFILSLEQNQGFSDSDTSDCISDYIREQTYPRKVRIFYTLCYLKNCTTRVVLPTLQIADLRLLIDLLYVIIIPGHLLSRSDRWESVKSRV